MNKVRFYRENKNYTQSELSEISGLSLRTVQRIESGAIPKGHTLKSIARALDVPESEIVGNSKLQEKDDEEQQTKIRLINILVLSFIIIPYTNVLFPFLIWRKNKQLDRVNEIGKMIINLQIFWTLLTSILLLLSPVIQQLFLLKFSLILWIYILAFVVNLYYVIQNTRALQKKSNLKIHSPITFI